MVSEITDYRISRVVILCKDCGQDVGFYPARHKCGQTHLDAPPLPSIPKKYTSGKETSTTKVATTTTAAITSPAQTSTLWNKFLNATIYTNNNEDSDNESEKDDHESETHISRILREYYEKKSGDLPNWLYDSTSTNDNDIGYNPSLNNNNVPLSSSYTNNSIKSHNNNNNNSTRQNNLYNYAASKSSPNLLQKSQRPPYSNERNPELPIKSLERNLGNNNNERIKNKRNDLNINNSNNNNYYHPMAHSPTHSPIPSPTYPTQSAQRGRQPPPNYNRSNLNDPSKISSNQPHLQYRGGNYYNDIPNANNANRARSVSPNPSPRVYNSNSSFNQNPNIDNNNNRYNNDPHGVRMPLSPPPHSSTPLSLRPERKKRGF